MFNKWVILFAALGHGRVTQNSDQAAAYLTRGVDHSIHTGPADYPVSFPMGTGVFYPGSKAKRA